LDISRTDVRFFLQQHSIKNWSMKNSSCANVQDDL
jgi:hypothetical protein